MRRRSRVRRVVNITALCTRLRDPVVDLARGSGARILEIYARDFDVRLKADDSPVTAADLAADRMLRAGLGSLEGGFPVLSEEVSAPPYSERRTWLTYWLVDPLDGTRGFVRRSGEFAVSIALIHARQAVLGVIYAPASDECYHAVRGGGACKDHGAKRGRRIRVRRCPNHRPTVITSRSRSNPETRRFLARLGPAEVLSLGSTLKACRVAEGLADVSPGFGETSEWDTAAAQCVVEEAGGALLDLEGRALRYNRGESLLNPRFIVIGDTSREWLDVVRGG